MMCLKGGGVEWERKGREAIITKQHWICHCGKDTSWMFHSFVWNWAGLMSGGAAVSLRPELLYLVTTWRGQPPLSLAAGSEPEATGTFMHKCLLHALNGCGLDGFLLLMHYQWDSLSASQPQSRHLFPSSVPLSTKKQWKFKQTPQGEVWIFK